MATIEIEAGEVELIDIRLVGVDYLINPPKTALTLGLADSFKGKNISAKKLPPLAKDATDAEKADHAVKEAEYAENAKEISNDMLKMLNTWIKQAFGKDTAKAIHKRLDDSEDRLDIPHLMKLMTAVAEEATGNPTT